MRSLGVTLTLAFIGITLAATILVAAVVSRSTFSGFISYLDAETSQLLADAGGEDLSGPNGDQNSKNSDINPTFNQNNSDPATVPQNGGRLNQLPPRELTSPLPGGRIPPPPPRPQRDDGRRFEPDTAAGNFEDTVNLGVILGITSGVLLAAVAGILIARQVIKPIKKLTTASQLLAEGELGYQVTPTTKNEIGDLTLAFNRMSSDLARSKELRQQMTADIAHDLRTPLTVIAGYTEGLSEGKVAPAQNTFVVMHEQVQHLQHLLDDLRTLSLSDAGELLLNKRAVDPRALLERTAVTYLQQAENHKIQLRVDASRNLAPVNVDVERMVQVLNNLVGNALRYTPENGQILLEGRQEGQHIILQVQDNGSDIAPNDLPNLFERSYRADETRQSTGDHSTGLGLAIAKAIVEANDGQISVTSEVDQGTIFTIDLTAV